MDDKQPITELLTAARGGDQDAVDSLFAVVYEDLRAVAHRQLMPRQQGQTLNTTALVHETYLKLADRSRISPEDRQHFFATAARAMRQIIVDHARKAQASKRGGKQRRSLRTGWENLLADEHLRVAELAAEILGVDRALSRLSSLDERLGKVVELRFFGGFSVEEVAELLQVSARTVKRDWQAARAFLYQELGEVQAG